MELKNVIKKIKREIYSPAVSDKKTTIKDGVKTIVTTSTTTLREGTVDNILWSKIKKGTYFTAVIYGDKIIGRIQKANGGQIYLLHNKEDLNDEEYDEDVDTLDLSYYYHIEDGDTDDLENYDVQEIRFFDKAPRGFKIGEAPIIIDGEEVEFNRGSIEVGCQTISNKTVLLIASKLKK